MLIDFPNFEDYLIEHDRESILQKGEKFYHEGLIKHIHAFSGTEWDIYVESERPHIPGYTVRVRISNYKVTQVTCNCQGFRFKQLCKHIVASLFVLREKKLYDERIGDYAYEESEEEDEKERVKEPPTTGKKEEKIEEEEQTPAKKKVQTKVHPQTEKSPEEKLATLEKEFQCQVCSKPFENPVTLPCNSHSACLKCAESILEEPKVREKVQELKCPTCGKKGGSILIKNVKELKPNRELERIKHAFEKEKDEWMKEKSQLEKELENLKGKTDSGKMTEEYRLNKEIHPLDEKTKEAAEAAFFNLKNDGQDADEFLKQIDKNKGNEETQENGKSPDVKKSGRKSSEREKGAKGNNKTHEKGTSKSHTNTNSAKRTHEKASAGKENAEEGAEKYGLRNKKVKSYAE